MKSVLIPVSTMTNKKFSTSHIKSKHTSNMVLYSELPGALMLGLDGKLMPLSRYGTDVEIKMPR